MSATVFLAVLLVLIERATDLLLAQSSELVVAWLGNVQVANEVLVVKPLTYQWGYDGSWKLDQKIR